MNRSDHRQVLECASPLALCQLRTHLKAAEDCRTAIRWRGSVRMILIAASLLANSCAKQNDPELLAKVGPSEIRLAQFQAQIIRRSGNRPDLVDRDALLHEMIEEEALYMRAMNSGLSNDPEVQRAWRNLLIGKLKERDLAPRLQAVEISQAEVESAYAASVERYTRPPAVKLAVLFLKRTPLTTPDQLAELQQRMADARKRSSESESSGAPGFGSLAISYSDDQATRYRGGVIGWVERNRPHAWLGTDLVEAGFSLNAPGDVSPVLTATNGVFLIKLMEQRAAETIPLRDVEPALRLTLLQDKRRQLEQTFASESVQSLPVVTYPEVLEGIPRQTASRIVENNQPPSLR